MEWPISWNDVKENMVPVIEFSSPVPAEGAVVIPLTNEELEILDKLAANGQMFIGKFKLSLGGIICGNMTFPCIFTHAATDGMEVFTYEALVGTNSIALSFDKTTGQWEFSAYRVE